jgi:CubicO group peptidase (beta-lactamase class C family)
MPKWLDAAADYVQRWLEFQMRWHEQPGCVAALAHRGSIVCEAAFGYADLARRTPLTARHRFRVASHSKSFTAAGIMKLQEQGKLRLRDEVGRYVKGLHPALAHASLEQLLSHSAGVVRDGPDSGQFTDRRPFLDEVELRAQLKAAPVLRRGTRFKYSNHGYGLLGLVIESVTDEAYPSWIQREIVAACGLEETMPDMPLARGTPFARGHTGRLPIGRRLVIPGDFRTNAIAPAGGFVSTAADLARFFSQLSPSAARSVISVRSRRAMLRRRWRDPHSSIERYYGLGIISGALAGWRWFGHSGGLQGYITRTVVLPGEIAVSVLTNSIDGLAHLWLDGAIHVLRIFERHGAPARQVPAWNGRWWTMWNAVDLVPVRGMVLVAMPALFNPFMDAAKIRHGRIALAGGFASHGEPARLGRKELWLGGARYVQETALARELAARYS